MRSIVGAAIGLCLPIAAWADEVQIHLEFRPVNVTVNVDEPVALGLWAYTSPDQTQLFRALDMVFTWESEYLHLDGLDATGAVILLASSFPAADGYGLNESVPPSDGDGYYRAWAPLGNPIEVSSEGALLTTFMFTAVEPADATLVSIALSGGQPPLETTVWGGPEANMIVTGDLGFATVWIVPEPSTGLAILIFGIFYRRSRG